MRVARLIVVLLASGLALLAAAIVLSTLPANATERSRTLGDGHGSPCIYTDHPSRASTGRTLALYVIGLLLIRPVPGFDRPLDRVELEPA